ncbi:MAG TPA: hypothetical protein DCX22_01585 [Dehalococcoidia bacterium]|nr:hypothetical protein [Dehalococcoidia bacterium]
MEKKKIHIEPISKIDSINVAIVVETVINWHTNDHGVLFIGRKKPLYVIYISSDRQKHIRHVTGEELSSNDLVQECPQAISEYDKLG